MIYMACALYEEAAPWIKVLGLKKNTEAVKFQIFENSSIFLVITGSGSIKAAAALTYLCALYPPCREDIFINTGMCGSLTPEAKRGNLFLIHKITGGESGRQYYPDILFEHFFEEAELVSYVKVQTENKKALKKLDEADSVHEPVSMKQDNMKPENTKQENVKPENTKQENVNPENTKWENTKPDNIKPVKSERRNITLADMEAEGLWCAGNVFFSPDRMIFIKYISDFCGGETVTRADVKALAENAEERIFVWLKNLWPGITGEKLCEKTAGNSAYGPDSSGWLDIGEESQVRELIECLKATEAMKETMRRHLYYYYLCGKNIRRFLEENKVEPCKTKREGKAVFERLLGELRGV